MNIINTLRFKFHQLNNIENQQNKLRLTMHKLQEALGRIENRHLQNFDFDSKNINPSCWICSRSVSRVAG